MHRPTFTHFAAAALVVGLALPAGASPEQKRADAEQAVSALLADVPSARAHWRADLVGPSMLLGLFLDAEGATARERAEAFVAEHAGLFGLQPSDLTYASESRARQRAVVTFQQVHGGRAVYGRTMKVTLDGEGRITRVVNNTFPVEGLRPATHSLAAVRDLALTKTRAERAAELDRIDRVVVAGPAGAYEAAVVRVAPQADRLDVVEVVVDQSRGEVTGLKQTVKR